MTLNPAEELVEIVDRDNRPIGALTRRLMREQGLIHRAAYILVFNTAGELFLQKRTLTKDIYPGYWDMAAGGVVLAGESYEAAARREAPCVRGSLAPPEPPTRFQRPQKAQRIGAMSIWNCNCDWKATPADALEHWCRRSSLPLPLLAPTSAHSAHWSARV